MKLTEWLYLEKRIKYQVDPERFHHTIGVMNIAAALAMVHGENIERARLAGLLHDCAKNIPNRKKISKCEKYDIEISDIERSNPSLLHGKLGAYYAKKKYGVDDDEICSAIACHTTGKPAMTPFEQIIFIADYIEPDRNEMPRLDVIRKTAFADLDKCTEMIMSDTLTYLKEANRVIDTETMRAYRYYHKLINK